MRKGGYIYILTNKSHKTLYVGVTNCLKRRVSEHKRKIHPNSFTARYNVSKLVYYEVFDRIEAAIAREKQLKAGNRARKLDLINKFNPHWEEIIPPEL